MEKIILILFGLTWGSFLNVVIYRLPRNLSLIRPPSSCPRCQSRIKFYDNIPVLSFILLGGKCRSCGAPISFSYPLVELITAMSFLILHAQYSWSLHFFASSVFASALIVLGFIDFFHQLLPDEITLPGLLLAIVYSLFRKDLNLRQSLIGAVVGAAFLLAIYVGYFLLRKKEGLGLGDITMMLLIGAFLGWARALLTLIVASLVGSAVGLFLIYGRKKDFQYSLPFGTFLAPAAFFSLLWGEKIIKAYMSLYKR